MDESKRIEKPNWKLIAEMWSELKKSWVEWGVGVWMIIKNKK